MNVAKAAKELADIYGCDKEKAYLAALLHDITKEFTKEQHFELIEKGNVKLTEIERTTQSLWHSITAPVYARLNVGIEDEDILNAIRYHTTGRENMSTFEKIIFTADCISDDRSYPELDEVRSLAFTDLDAAVLAKLKYAIEFLVKKDRPICGDTVSAYNELVMKKNERTE